MCKHILLLHLSRHLQTLLGCRGDLLLPCQEALHRVQHPQDLPQSCFPLARIIPVTLQGSRQTRSSQQPCSRPC